MAGAGEVLALPCIAGDCTARYSTLTGRSIAEASGDVYLGTYNVAPGRRGRTRIYLR